MTASINYHFFFKLIQLKVLKTMQTKTQRQTEKPRIRNANNDRYNL